MMQDDVDKLSLVNYLIKKKKTKTVNSISMFYVHMHTAAIHSHVTEVIAKM